MEKIKSWSRDDRPREKLIDNGRSNLSNAELIALILEMDIRIKVRFH